jgi:Flp pilus assembly pilin Flp
MSRISSVIARLRKNTTTLARDTRGIGTVEYVIMLVLVAILAIGAWQSLGSAIQKNVGGSTEKLDGLMGSGTSANTPRPPGQ